jgi:hypothetical protein
MSGSLNHNEIKIEHFAGEENHHVLLKIRKFYPKDWEKSQVISL